MQIDYAQTTGLQTQAARTDYAKKRNTFNTLGWVSLGAGTAMILVGGLAGFADAVGGTSYSDRNNTLKGSGLATGGTIFSLGSIPLFIVAHHYKQKARLSLQQDHVYLNKALMQSYTAMVLKVRL
jgi:uncharacterized membrane protein